MSRMLLSFAFAALLAAPSAAAIVTETVEYKEGDTTLEGYLAYDDSVSEPRPGIVIIHQWLGLTEYEKMRARQMAAEGYIAFAADIYGKGVRPTNTQDAGAQAGKYRGDAQLFRARLTAALEQLKAHEMTDDERLGAFGYCFGGSGALQLAMTGADLDGVVSFHGGLGPAMAEDADQIQAEVLILHGAEDLSAKMDDVVAFAKKLGEADVDYSLVFFSDALHSFTEDREATGSGRPSEYQQRAAQRSWEMMRTFFQDVFDEQEIGAPTDRPTKEEKTTSAVKTPSNPATAPSEPARM